MNIRLSELEELEQGFIIDMITESGNDNCEYNEVANNEDLARF